MGLMIINRLARTKEEKNGNQRFHCNWNNRDVWGDCVSISRGLSRMKPLLGFGLINFVLLQL